MDFNVLEMFHFIEVVVHVGLNHKSPVDFSGVLSYNEPTVLPHPKDVLLFRSGDSEATLNSMSCS